MTQQPPITEDTQEMVERLREIADELEATGTVELYDCHLPAITHAVEAASQLAGVIGERDALREALKGAADELKSCAEQFRALKMTTCAQYAEAQEAKARAALSPNQGAKL